MSIRANIAALRELTLIPLAALVALVSGLVFLALIILAFFGFFWGWFGIFVVPWSLFAACVTVRNGVECLQIMNDPDGRRMAIVGAWYVAAALSCPFLWMR